MAAAPGAKAGNVIATAPLAAAVLLTVPLKPPVAANWFHSSGRAEAVANDASTPALAQLVCLPDEERE